MQHKQWWFMRANPDLPRREWGHKPPLKLFEAEVVEKNFTVSKLPNFNLPQGWHSKNLTHDTKIRVSWGILHPIPFRFYLDVVSIFVKKKAQLHIVPLEETLDRAATKMDLKRRLDIKPSLEIGAAHKNTSSDEVG